MSNRPLRTVIVCAAAALLTACVDSSDPVAVDLARSATVRAVPRFAVTPALSTFAQVDLLRVSLKNSGDGSVLLADTTAIDPATESEWPVQFTVDLTGVESLSLFFEIEFVELDTGTEVVEWSGRSGDIEVTASFETRDVRAVDVFPGPLANLDLTELSFDEKPTVLLHGGSFDLDWTPVPVVSGARYFLESSNPSVASVDEFGHIEALSPGTTVVTLRAGRRSDTFELSVDEVLLPTAEVILATIMPTVDYVTAPLFLATFGDPDGAAGIADGLGLVTGAMLAGDGPTSVGHFEDAVLLWEAYGEGTELRTLDGPQLGIMELTLIQIADAIKAPF